MGSRKHRKKELKNKHQDLTNEYSMLKEEIRGNSKEFLHISTFALPIKVTVLVTSWK